MDTEIILPNMTYTVQITGCQFAVKPPDWLYPRHHHHLFELLYCWDGEVTQSSEDQQVTMRAGELILLKPGVKHHTFNHSNGYYSFFNVHFNIDDKELRELLTKNSFELFSNERVKQSKLLLYIKEIESLLQLELLRPGSVNRTEQQLVMHLSGVDKLLFQNQLLLIINEVAMLLHQQHPAEEEQHGKKMTSRLQVDVAHEMEAMLQDHLFSKGAVAHIARKQNLSRSQCYKIFMQVYGMSPRQYLTQLKLNKAKHLLLESEMSIEDIAQQLGFSSLSHFSRQFKRWTGVPPMQYRPKHKD